MTYYEDEPYYPSEHNDYEAWCNEQEHIEQRWNDYGYIVETNARSRDEKLWDDLKAADRARTNAAMESLVSDLTPEETEQFALLERCFAD